MRKYIALILSFIFLLPCITSYAENVTSDFSYNNDNYLILCSLGIIKGYEDGAFKLEDEVSRAEFAMLMSMLVGMDELAVVPEHTVFHDVTTTYWGSKYIDLVYRLGIMNGTSDFTFEPEGSISLEQASKVFVKITGRGELAEAYGGYPIGYMTVASKNNITDGVFNTVLTRADVLRMMMNVLESNGLEEISFSNESIELGEGKTLFEKYHGIRKLDGQLVSTGQASIFGKAITDEHFVRVDDCDYNAYGKEYFSYLGQQVDFYVDKDNRILYMIPNGNSEVVTVSRENIDSNETGFTNNGEVRFVYYEGTRKKTVTLSHETGYIINNRPYKPPFVLENIIPSDGQVTLVDGNSDGKFEMVTVDKYDVLIAKNINSYEGFITDELNQNALYELNESDKIVKTIRNGKEIRYGEIPKGSTLLVKKSQDEKYIEIIVSDQTVTGKLESHSESSDEITLDGVTYKLHPDFDTSSLKLGTSNTYCIDYFGRVVWIDNSKIKNSGYCYLFGAKLSSMDDRLDIQVLEADGSVSEISSNKNKIKFNDVTTGVKDVCAMLCDSQGKTIEQVIILKKTQDGFIESIKADQMVSLDYAPAARSYSVTQKLFGAYEPDGFAVSDNTPVFIIKDEHSDCKVIPITSLQDNTEYDTVEGYNGKETFVCEAVVIRPQSGSDTVSYGWSTPLGIVEGVYKTINSKGDVVNGLKVFVNGAKVKLTITEKAFVTKIKMPGSLQTIIPLSDIKPGDVVHYNLNMDGEIENIGRIFPYETGSTAETENEYTDSHGWSRERTFGTVNRIVGDYMSVKVGTDYYTFMIKNAPVRVYDYDEGECREGTLDDIIDYETDSALASKIFIRANYGKIDDIIVFKNY